MTPEHLGVVRCRLRLGPHGRDEQRRAYEEQDWPDEREAEDERNAEQLAAGGRDEGADGRDRERDRPEHVDGRDARLERTEQHPSDAILFPVGCRPSQDSPPTSPIAPPRLALRPVQRWAGLIQTGRAESGVHPYGYVLP